MYIDSVSKNVFCHILLSSVFSLLQILMNVNITMEVVPKNVIMTLPVIIVLV